MRAYASLSLAGVIRCRRPSASFARRQLGTENTGPDAHIWSGPAAGCMVEVYSVRLGRKFSASFPGLHLQGSTGLCSESCDGVGGELNGPQRECRASAEARPSRAVVRAVVARRMTTVWFLAVIFVSAPRSGGHQLRFIAQPVRLGARATPLSSRRRHRSCG